MVNAFHPDMVQVMDPRSHSFYSFYLSKGPIDSWIPDENEGFSVNRLAWVVDDV